jgi:hypothetical protein
MLTFSATASRVVAMSEHQPHRGTWMCIGCGQPWPCPPRRRQLLDTYADSPTALALVLSSALMDACRDLPNVRAGEPYQQVVGWLPSFRNSGRAW